jgi:hypothetical protein
MAQVPDRCLPVTKNTTFWTSTSVDDMVSNTQLWPQLFPYVDATSRHGHLVCFWMPLVSIYLSHSISSPVFHKMCASTTFLIGFPCRRTTFFDWISLSVGPKLDKTHQSGQAHSAPVQTTCYPATVRSLEAAVIGWAMLWLALGQPTHALSISRNLPNQLEPASL